MLCSLLYKEPNFVNLLDRFFLFLQLSEEDDVFSERFSFKSFVGLKFSKTEESVKTNINITLLFLLKYQLESVCMLQ